MDNEFLISAQQIIHHRFGGNYYTEVDAPPLSIKCMFNGSARYRVGNHREYVVDDAGFLILNAGTPYSITKSSTNPVETFCLFFPPWLLPSVTRDITQSADTLLDDGGIGPGRSHGFFERRYCHGNAITSIIQSLRNFSSKNNYNNGAYQSGFEERVYRLVFCMLIEQQGIERKIAKLPAAKVSTRHELYRRVCWARDYMHANQSQSLSLAEIAAVACLSPYHFLRIFRQFFDLTPHSYMNRLRLQKAKELLVNSPLSVTETAHHIGFYSLPSFIQWFRKNQGLTPLQYRRQKRN